MKREWEVVGNGELTEFLNRSWPGHDLFIAKIKNGGFEIRKWTNRDKQEFAIVLPISDLNIDKSTIRKIENKLGKINI